MRSGFHQHFIGRIILLIVFLCLVVLVVLPLTNRSRQTLSLEAEKDIQAEAAKNIEKGLSPRIDSHNGLLKILSGNELAKETQSPFSMIGTSEPSKPTEAQRENSLQDRDTDSNGDRFEDPEARAEFYRLKRVPVGATGLPMGRYQAALDHMAKMRRYSTASNQFLPSKQEAGQTTLEALGTWTSLGPGNIGGRTRAIVIDPSNSNTMFAAAVAGGVWKSTNGGTSWFPTSDLIANLATCSLAMDHSNPNVLYAGTGEPYSGSGVRGNGIFKTTDGGASWTQLGATANNSNFYYVNHIVISPSNSQRLYAATSTGVWRSIDGGAYWTLVLNPNISYGCTDLTIRTDAKGQTSDWLFAACGIFSQATVYRNTNAAGAGTWDAVLTEANMGRTSLALAPSNQETVYALSSDLTDLYARYALHAVFRSTSGGALGSWTARVRNTDTNQLNTLLLTNVFLACANPPYFYSQGSYDNVIAVDPTNENRVWVGGINIFRSDDGGANWGCVLYSIHVDQHAIVFHPQYDALNNKTMFVGNDGGLYRTTDAIAPVRTGTAVCSGSGSGFLTFTSLNSSYSVTQFYNGVPYPNGSTYFGGTQDNGTVRGSDADGPNGWRSLQGGDGGYVAVDPTNTNTIYTEQINISIQKSTDGGVTFNDATSGIDDLGLFISPFIMDPTNSHRLWTGGSILWRTSDSATTWTQASSKLGCCVSSIAVSPVNANNVLAGTISGVIHRTGEGTTSTSTTIWSGVSPRFGWVSWLAYDPANPSIAYATYSTFNSLSTDRHVYKSTDGGATWTGIDGSVPNNLPDVPTHAIAVDPTNPQRLFVGTDVGVFSSLDGGATWAIENTGFANVITEALAINYGTPSSKYLFAFTHGRGAWRVLVNSGCLTITSLSDYAAEVGSIVTIRGEGFLNATSVKFSNNVSAPFSVVDDTQILAAVPFGAVTGPIIVSKANCADAQSGNVTISSCPSIMSLSRLAGGIGDTIMINGAGFLNATSVKFANNVSAPFSILSTAQITTSVPAGAVTGPISVTKPGCVDAQSSQVAVFQCPHVTLAADDGDAEQWFGQSTGTNPVYVNRLTPVSYPATLTAILLNFTSEEPSFNLPLGTSINVVRGINPSGSPNIDNIVLQTTPATVRDHYNFTYYSVPPITINSGDFVVGYSVVGAGAPNLAYEGIDTTPPLQGRSYYSPDGSHFFSRPGNYLIRAEVFPGTCPATTPTPTPTPTPSPTVDPTVASAKAHVWLRGRMLSTGLIDSYQNADDICYTYDQAVAAIAFLAKADNTNARRVLDAMKILQGSDGSWYTAYFGNGSVQESQRHVGPVMWMALAVASYERRTGDIIRYRSMAQKAINWCLQFQQPDGGINGGLDFSGNPLTWASVEHNEDAYAALSYFGDTTHAAQVKSFIDNAGWDAANNRFFAGRNDPNDPLDVNPWGVSALGASGTHDYRRAVDYALSHHRTTQTATLGSRTPTVDGFDFNSDRNDVWLEGTAQMVVAFKVATRLSEANYFRDQIILAQDSDGGVPYSLKGTNNGYFTMLTDKAVASSSWLIFASDGINPLMPSSAPTPQWQPVVLTAQQIAQIKAWTVGGRTYVYVKPQFPDAGYRVVNWGQFTRVRNDFTVDASFEKFTGSSIQAVVTTAQIYDLGLLADATYNFNFKTSGTLAKTLQFTVSSATPPPNPIDNAREFVRQQYRDFLNREADQAGEDFWTDNITKCSDPARRPAGQTEAQCTLRQRETTSGAFFLSPEFQYTGYYVLRMYKGALGRQPKLSEFIPDAQFVGAGILVNSQLSGARINQNKADFAAQFVNCTDAAKYRCAEFKAIYDGLNNQQYVDKLFQTTGVNASASDRAALVNGLNANPATETRASVLQKVVDGIVVISEGNQQFTTSYGQAFYNAESNRAFVQLEYFGYMKRDPDDAGYAFWLGKLNQFGGNFVNAEMVLAFISSPEYRARFGQP